MHIGEKIGQLSRQLFNINTTSRAHKFIPTFLEWLSVVLKSSAYTSLY